MMADFGMRSVRASIELAVENDSAANSRPHGDVNQPRLPFSGAPRSLSQRRGVAIVFERDAHVEFSRQIVHRIAAFPAGKKVHVAEFAGEGINPAGRANADAGKLGVGL